MSLKKIICLSLFILPLLGMLAILFNYKSPVSSTIVNPDGSVRTVSTINWADWNWINANWTNGDIAGQGLVGNSWNADWANGNWVQSDDINVSPDNNSIWITRRVGNINSTYKLDKDFSKCNVAKNVSDTLSSGIVAGLAKIDRIEFLEILMDTHCINYKNADTSNLAFADVWNDDTKTKQIIKTAIDLWIARGYDEGDTKVFRPNNRISKVEALAILISLSGLELKEKAPENNFADVENNWKSNIADTSYRLGVTPIDSDKNLFFPEYIMNKWDAYDIIGKIARYY